MNQPPGPLISLLNKKCPRCRKGRMFKYKAYDLKRFMIMYDRCPHCDLKYEIETGFWWGAMYITYTFTSGLFICAMFLYLGVLVEKLDVWTFSALFVTFIILLVPLLVRYSRVVLLYVFGSITFDPALYAQESPSTNPQ